ncbi:hypothetical protein [Pseudonocardia acaciae]|uniref:hypothetical protein n=1 Tax=Pseudonocardia acaciae TaxID=551276 RepID=UPI0007E8DC2C|nr:hypothetical protein [Pseudonocardia acaciae]
MAENARDEAESQSFASFLCTHSRGRSEKELSAHLRELVAAVQDTGKPGALTYTLTLKPTPRAEHALLVSDQIKVKSPEYERPASIFFADEQHNLVRSDPRQLSFEQAFAHEANPQESHQ